MLIDADTTLGLVEQPPRGLIADKAQPEMGDPNLGRRIGPYRIESLVGRGGMGVIYLAVREDDFTQRVALKLVSPGLRTSEILRRFYKERQILAHLEHPSIARILDGGTTDDALPYFVMEYVEGWPIDRYCDEHELPLRRRLELFRSVCSAVHFAHQNLVVHRDLKPANILITPQGQAKLLDFGIAKILHAEASASDTQPGKNPMTPEYASPEQILGQRITTASDVYSLGVLLYRLVSGRLPYRFKGCGPARMAEIVCHERPLPPSAGAKLEAGSGRVGADIDAIVLKAMNKQPRERYASALQLADDLGNHLEDRPVRARQGGWIYRVGKLARRHKLGLAAALLLIAFAITTTVNWRQAVGQRSRAEAAQLRAERVSDFLEELFRSADPDTAEGELAIARKFLDRGREKLTEGLQEEPEVRAELLSALGTVYNNLALYQEARELKEEALRTRRAADPADRFDLASDLNNLARAYYSLGDYPAAEDRFHEALAMWRRLGDESNAAVVMRNLAAIEMHRGRYEASSELYSRVLEIQQRRDASDLEVAKTLHSLGTQHRLRGAPEEAERLLRQALEIFSRNYGQRHTKVASVLGALGRTLHAQGRYSEARKSYERSLDVRRGLLGEDHVQVAVTRKNLAALLLDQGDTDGAAKLLEAALDTLRKAKPAGDWTIADAESVWGRYLTELGRFPEAEPFLLSAHHTLREVKGDRDVGTRSALRRVVELYEAWGREDRAAEYRASSP